MYKNIGQYYIKNGDILDASEFEFDFTDQKILYEVIRVIDNHPLFLDDHLERLKHSLRKSGVTCEIGDLKFLVNRLIDTNPPMDKNIKIDVTNYSFRLYFMESFYPEKDKYDKGVKTITASIERDNPTVKRLNMSYKNTINEIKGDNFEVLLVNSLGKITEGSRANLLFIKDKTLYSTPLDEILVGVTFKNIIKMAENLHVPIKFQSIDLNDISQMEACFLTGTSLGVLPIKQVDDVIYDSSNHDIVLQLMEAYKTQVKGD